MTLILSSHMIASWQSFQSFLISVLRNSLMQPRSLMVGMSWVSWYPIVQSRSPFSVFLLNTLQLISNCAVPITFYFVFVLKILHLTSSFAVHITIFCIFAQNIALLVFLLEVSQLISSFADHHFCTFAKVIALDFKLCSPIRIFCIFAQDITVEFKKLPSARIQAYRLSVTSSALPILILEH